MILNLEHLRDTYNCAFDDVLHVGAHHGQEYQTYKALHVHPIVFIEAVPDTYNILVSNVGSECVCINTAIGNMEGTVEMYVDEANLGGSSSVLRPSIHLKQYPSITFPKRATVPITRVDSLDIPQCNFVNMDIQGYELEALKGAERYLEKVNYIMLEVNRDEVYENCAHIEEIDDYLKKYGILRVETDWAGNTWGDAFYIKR